MGTTQRGHRAARLPLLRAGRRTLPRFACLGLLAFAACTPVGTTRAQTDEGDPEAGRRYAEEVCEPCHWVSEDRFVPGMYAPAFVDVANTPGMTPMALYAWLQTSHEMMPDLIVPPEETADVIAYIWGLRGQEW